MRVSNMEGQNRERIKRIDTRRGKAGDFAKLLLSKEEAQGCHREEGNHGTALTVSVDGEQRAIYAALGKEKLEEMMNKESIMFLGTTRFLLRQVGEGKHVSVPYPEHIRSLMEPVELDLGSLTEERKAELNEKYHIKDLTIYSWEYHRLLQELQEDGILSDCSIDPLFRAELYDLEIDGKGNIACVGTKGLDDINADPVSVLEEILWDSAERYEGLQRKGNLTRVEQALLVSRKANENIYTALKEIFAGQLA